MAAGSERPRLMSTKQTSGREALRRRGSQGRTSGCVSRKRQRLLHRARRRQSDEPWRRRRSGCERTRVAAAALTLTFFETTQAAAEPATIAARCPLEERLPVRRHEPAIVKIKK